MSSASLSNGALPHSPPSTGVRSSGGRRPRSPQHASWLSLLGWLGPSLVLVLGVVIYPLVETVRASFQSFSLTGAVKGWAGWRNFRTIVENPAFPRVVANTAVWVLGVVLVATLLALPLAQLMSKSFFGHRLLSFALLVPWATSVVMTAIGFRWVLNYYYGVLNPFLMKLHLIDGPVDWLGDDRTIRWVLIGVAVFVSLPFTIFALLSGLRTISGEVLEAAAIDGASKWQSYRHIVLPLLRGPLVVTVLLNSIWVFNSFPIVYVLNKSNPGYVSDTSTTFMYKVAFLTEHDVGAGAAMAVLNVIIVGLCVGLFMRRNRME